MNESRLRDRLIDLAAEAPDGFVASPTLLRRAHRRVALVRAASIAAVLVVVVGGVFGVRALDNPSNRAVQPIKNDKSVTAGWMVYRSGTELIAVDPDHPGDALSVGPSHGMDPIAWSRDGSELLLRYGHETEDLYLLDAGGARIRLTREGTSYSGSFSPDGRMVVYEVVASEKGHFVGGLYVIWSGGTPTVVVPARGPTAMSDPAWSPTGSLIAFIERTIVGETSWGEPVYRLTLSVVNADGTHQHDVLDLGREDTSPTGWARGLTWSPDGSRLAFSSQDVNSDPRGLAQVYVVNADGSRLRRLTDGGDNWNPVFSPDGSRIGFNCGSLLCTMAADGSNLRAIPGTSPTPTSRFIWTSSLEPLT